MPGTTDTVKAILTPGEFVIRKEAVDMIGVPTLEKLNDMPEAGGHSEIDRLIAQATLKNMTGMYGGGMVNAKQYGHGGMVNKYEDGGQAMSNLKPVPDNNPGLAKLPENVRNKMGYMQDGGLMEMMHGGKAKKKKEMYSYQDGGQALSQEQIEALMPEQDFKDRMIPLGLRDSRRVTDFIDPDAQFDKFKNIDSGMSPTQDDEGIEILANMLLKDAEKKEYSQLYNYELPTMQVTDSQRYKAIMDLFKDMGGNKRNLLGMQEGGSVQEDAMMQQYLQSLMNQQPQANPFVPFDQRPPSSGEVMSSIPSGMEQGDYYRSLRGELEMENEELVRDKAQNTLERIRLDSLLNQGAERIERVPNDSSYFQNTPAQDNFMQKFKENMLNPTYFPEGS